ncbi:hypothetical protein [Agrobacterium sp. MA01]
MVECPELVQQDPDGLTQSLDRNLFPRFV